MNFQGEMVHFFLKNEALRSESIKLLEGLLIKKWPHAIWVIQQQAYPLLPEVAPLLPRFNALKPESIPAPLPNRRAVFGDGVVPVSRLSLKAVGRHNNYTQL